MTTKTVDKPNTNGKQADLPGLLKNSPLGRLTAKWFTLNDDENDAADGKLEVLAKIGERLRKDKREGVTVPHPDTGKPKKFFIEKGRDKVKVITVVEKVGRTVK